MLFKARWRVGVATRKAHLFEAIEDLPLRETLEQNRLRNIAHDPVVIVGIQEYGHGKGKAY